MELWKWCSLWRHSTSWKCQSVYFCSLAVLTLITSRPRHCQNSTELPGPGRACSQSHLQCCSLLLPSSPPAAHDSEHRYNFLTATASNTSLNWNQSSLEMSDSVATNFIVSGVLTHQLWRAGGEKAGRRIKCFIEYKTVLCRTVSCDRPAPWYSHRTYSGSSQYTTIVFLLLSRPASAAFSGTFYILHCNHTRLEVLFS